MGKDSFPIYRINLFNPILKDKAMEKIRISKYFTDCGVMSRRAAEEEIRLGRVSVNGHVAELGEKIDPETDEVTWKGKVIKAGGDEKICIMLNKPRGIVCTASDEKGRRNVTDLCRDVKGTDGKSVRLYPVGRLDMDSDGLLLMTNDGELTNILTHPRHEIPKIYHITVKGQILPHTLDELQKPMEIDGYTILPVKAKIIAYDSASTTLEMTLFEGRNRQIRKMCELCSLKITRLCRVALGDVKLGELEVGKWRYLTDDEVKYLKESSKK